ncbi:MAG: polysaccharide deacetylase family protein [Kiritimatiellae bacterium]|nr:polysaccharide deacetylase family protein [Kiritimatiellia bacterium]
MRIHPWLRTALAGWAGWVTLASAATVAEPPATTPESGRQGALVLQFDDGWTSWVTDIAPELQRVGGCATGFVTWQYVESGRIGLPNLLQLQNEYGWEIGTHAATHASARKWAVKHGVDSWIAEQLVAPLQRLKDAGLDARSLAFPFNDYTPELARAAREHVESFRRPSTLALAARPSADGAFPGTAIDLNRYVPVSLLKEWVDMAHQQNRMLLLYGHRVLPDESFFNARVVAVRDDELELDRPVVLPKNEDLVLVPDIARRLNGDSLRGFTAEGNKLRLPGAGFTRLAAPGSRCRIGAAYGLARSDFVALLDYAAPRLHFLRMREAVAQSSASMATADKMTD